MTNKVLVKLFVPVVEENFEVWVPINKKIGDVIILLCKSINELIGGYYLPDKMPILYDKTTGRQYNVYSTVNESSIRNNSELILI